MSHVVASETEIPATQLNTLVQAFKQLGFEFCEGQTTYKWFGRWVDDYDRADAAYKNGIKPEDYGKCVHAFRLPGCAYEVGLYRHPETGNFRLIYDFFGPGKELRAKLGQSCENVWNLQGEIWAKAYAKAKGLNVTKRVVNGVIEMVFTK